VGEAAAVVEVVEEEMVVEEGPGLVDVPDRGAPGAPSGGSGSSALGHGNWTPGGHALGS
jgi:hypothetical protein